MSYGSGKECERHLTESNGECRSENWTNLDMVLRAKLSGGRIRAPSDGKDQRQPMQKFIAEAFFGRRDVNMASTVMTSRLKTG